MDAAMDSRISFVTVIEAGAIELKAVRLAESLRTWGGSFSKAPFVFVRPRRGPSLSRSTLRRMHELGVTYVQTNASHQYEWYDFLNKPIAIRIAAEKIRTPYLCWLDDDVLVLDEPTRLVPEADEDFLACPADLNMGSTGPGHRFEPYWDTFCNSIGISLNDLGVIRVHRENVLARTYFNSGVMVFRLSSEGINAYVQTTIAALNARIRSSTEGIYMHEQMSVGIAAIKCGLNIGSLPVTYNFSSIELFDPLNHSAADSMILFHYHDAFFPERFDQLCAAFFAHRPDRLQYVQSLGMINMSSLSSLGRLQSRFFRAIRRRKQKKYMATCRVIDTAGANS
jgi:hypothetical protein